VWLIAPKPAPTTSRTPASRAAPPQACSPIHRAMARDTDHRWQRLGAIRNTMMAENLQAIADRLGNDYRVIAVVTTAGPGSAGRCRRADVAAAMTAPLIIRADGLSWCAVSSEKASGAAKPT
jgi:hypothetical protein